MKSGKDMMVGGKRKDLEIGKANKRIGDLTKKNNELNEIQNRLAKEGNLPPPSPAPPSGKKPGTLPQITTRQGSNQGIRTVVPTPAKIGDISIDNFFTRWNNSGNNDLIKAELLEKVIGQNNLKIECVKRK